MGLPSVQGGAGGAGVGGWIRSPPEGGNAPIADRLMSQHIHLSDARHVPDFGRIAEPQDIFGSLEVDGQGLFVQPKGRYQPSGTYRIVTREGV